MNAIKYWQQISFWNKVNNTIQVIGTFTQLSLIFGESQHIYNVMVALIQLAGMLLPIWFTDENKDGRVDVFEKEVTVTVKSDTPIDVQTDVKESE